MPRVAVAIPLTSLDIVTGLPGLEPIQVPDSQDCDVLFRTVHRQIWHDYMSSLTTPPMTKY